MSAVLTRSCEFETQRLEVRDWHSESWSAELKSNLPATVAGMLTASVTRSLPDAWHGDFTPKRGRDWIEERDGEGATLLVAESDAKEPVGLVMLFELDTDDGVEVRLGYLLAEAAWGKGFATELVAGLIAWCRRQAGVTSIAGGVARDNPASKRVLEKNGFVVSTAFGESDANEEVLRLVLA